MGSGSVSDGDRPNRGERGEGRTPFFPCDWGDLPPFPNIGALALRRLGFHIPPLSQHFDTPRKTPRPCPFRLPWLWARAAVQPLCVPLPGMRNTGAILTRFSLSPRVLVCLCVCVCVWTAFEFTRIGIASPHPPPPLVCFYLKKAAPLFVVQNEPSGGSNHGFCH